MKLFWHVFLTKGIFITIKFVAIIYISILAIPIVWSRESGSNLNCQTANCHGNLRSMPYVHRPILATHSCDLCHKTVENQHFTLKRSNSNLTPSNFKATHHPKLETIKQNEVNSICLKCHEAFGQQLKKGPHIHSAIDKESCIACHDPHSSNWKFQLKENPQFELCLSCHKTIAGTQKSALHHQINKMKNGCLGCHTAHQSDNRNLLLKADITKLCLDCHIRDLLRQGSLVEKIPSIENFWKGNVHEPVRRGECLSCHEVHGATKDFLILKSYSKQSYGSFSLSNDELCFSCHKEELATLRQTTQVTKFRNGDLNLHVAHLQDQRRQKTCYTCHEIHASTQDHLIRHSFLYKELELPIRYTKDMNGGKCATACHKELRYDRVKAYINEK